MQDGDIEPTTQGVLELLRNHQYTDGFSFLDYGTPTNNLKGEPSGYSRRDKYDYELTFPYALGTDISLEVPSSVSDELYFQSINKLASNNLVAHKTHAAKFAEGLGYPLVEFKHIINADGYDSPLGKLVQKATWFALGGQMLDMLFGDNIDNATHGEIWEFYSSFVDAKGPFPAIKLRDQPYGILPVVHLRGILNNDTVADDWTTQERINFALSILFREWLDMARWRPPVEEEPNNEESDDNASDTEESVVNYVPRIEDVANAQRDEEIVRILSMEPRSSFFQLRILERERIPAWFTRIVHTPQSLQTYPPLMVHELLNGNEGYTRDLSYADTNQAVLYNLFQELFPEEPDRRHLLKYAPLFTFNSIDVLRLDKLNNPEDEEDPPPQIHLTNGDSEDWHKKAFFDFIASLDVSDTTTLDWFHGDLSVLTDLLLSSYSKAVSLYYRDVYFQPALEDVENVFQYKVDTILIKGDSVDLNQTDVAVLSAVHNPSRKFFVKAPLTGSVEHAYYKVGDILKDDSRLVRVKDEVGYTSIRGHMTSLGAQIILEIERLLKNGADLKSVQEIALAETLDLNSFRLDAWLTGIAAKRLYTLRNGEFDETGNVIKGPLPSGFYVGAYGWVDNLKVNPTLLSYEPDNQTYKYDEYDADGGIIHTPTPAQAVTSAMFRQSFSTYYDEIQYRIPDGNSDKLYEANPFTIKLTSDRMQKALRFMEGIRQGQDVEALLGYQFEKYLHEHNLQDKIFDLREQFPLTINLIEGTNGIEGRKQMAVVNGLELMKDYANQPQQIRDGIDVMANILDGSADMLFFEAGYQMSQGNFSQAAAAMDAAKGTIDPPQLEAFKTHLPGKGLTHKLIMLFEPPPTVTDDPAINPKAFVEPTLEHWLSQLLGPLEAIGCLVKVAQILPDETFSELGVYPVSLDQLEVGYLDLLFMALTPLNDAASELEQRLSKVALTEHLKHGTLPDDIRYEVINDLEQIPPSHNRISQSVSFALDRLQYVHEMLGEARSLMPEDIASNKELNTVDQEESEQAIKYASAELSALHERINVCIKALEDESFSLETLSHFNIESAKSHVLNVDDEIQTRSLNEAQYIIKRVQVVLAKIKDGQNVQARFRYLQEAAGILFGKPFYLILPFFPTPAFSAAFSSNQDPLVGEDNQVLPEGIMGGQERIRHWLEGRSQVDIPTEKFSDLLMVFDEWQAGNLDALFNPYLSQCAFRIVQYSQDETFPWIALDKNEISALRPSETPVVYPERSEAIVAFAPQSIRMNGSQQYGLLIDHFSEVIPNQEIDTAVALQYNGPNNQPPQSILLAVPTENKSWTADLLKDIVFDTIDLAKVRMVDADAISRFGNIFPMPYWFSEKTYKTSRQRFVDTFEAGDNYTLNVSNEPNNTYSLEDQHIVPIMPIHFPTVTHREVSILTRPVSGNGVGSGTLEYLPNQGLHVILDPELYLARFDIIYGVHNFNLLDLDLRKFTGIRINFDHIQGTMATVIVVLHSVTREYWQAADVAPMSKGSSHVKYEFYTRFPDNPNPIDISQILRIVIRITGVGDKLGGGQDFKVRSVSFY